ncbi:MAG: Bifunctional homocysteine S-methyltransferase/5,10-methylenetetrahydrofolate reductase [Syntrophus sp. PtaB.Bin001]|nr:MAG: Bifunctional homocysteine S-methyltransferase/5,10-methylenetetrahydrofolate reductase [Syntrophus sp. PtaB.Bin001]
MSAMDNIISRMIRTPLIFDGAMGTMIYEKGIFIQTCYDELCLTNPGLIREIHEQYVQAGAEVLETNSFGANRIKLRPYGLAEKVIEINRAAAKIARLAAGRTLYVAGSVGPCTQGGQVITGREIAEVETAFREQMAALTAEGVDLLLLETFSDLKELKLASRVAREMGVSVLASFAVDDEGETASGTPAESIAAVLDADPNVDAIGLNCGTGPSGIYEALLKILPVTDKPVVVMPNAGMPRAVGGRTLYLANPEYFTEYAKKFVELGVRGIGGCCGVHPAHISTMARAVRGLSGIKKHIEVVARPPAPTQQHVIPTAAKSRLAAKLCSGEKVTSVEILPPRASDFGSMLAKVRRCREAGIDAINIPDGPRASARVSPMITALVILKEVGIEPVVHYCCRDRNLIGMQSDLLGGYAVGLANYLIITGDPPKLGNCPEATGVFDVDAVGLTSVIHNLNSGWDIGGSPVDPPTGILIGVGANPCAVDLEREIDRYFQKIEAGAEFAITQPIFDVDALFRFLDRVEKYSKRIPVLAGVWPLLSYRNAEFMNNEVPGVVVPQDILDRMAECETGEESRQRGIEIARTICARIHDRVAGFQVSAPLNNVEIALSVLGKIDCKDA